MKIKKALLSLIFLLAVGSLAAQEGISVYEGARFSYRVDFHEGNRYEWKVFSQLGPPVEAVPGEFSFTGMPDLNETEIQWELAGIYYLKVTETDPTGCSNTKALAVQVLPNNRSIGFDALASSECFDPADNGFELPVSFWGNDGEPLAQNQFPINVEFTVNGTAYEQTMHSSADNLQIESTMFAANSAEDTQVVVEITGASDAHSAELFPGEENSTHTRTIYATPVIEFTQQMKLQKELNEETTAHIIYSPVGFDWQEPGSDYTRGE